MAKSRLDILEIADELGLRKGEKKGEEIRYFDPADNETPDLSINPQKNQWFTFAKGQNKGGGYVDLVCHVNDLDREQACEWLAEKFPDQYGNLDEEEIEVRGKARDVLQKATDLAHSTLMNQREEVKKGIMQKRDFEEEDLKEAKIGFLSRDGVAALKGRFNEEELIASGLFLKGNNDEVYCHLKNRIIFPYLNDNQPKFMAGRVMPENEEEADAKYKKTVTTDYNDHILYMFTEGQGELIITEGFTDTISAWKAGYDVVSPATVRFRREDLKKIERICRHYEKVYIVNDGDESGKEGANKTAKYLAHQGMKPEIVRMGEGKDLDDWTTENGYELDELIEDSESLLQQRIDNYRRADTDSIEQKKEEIFELLLNWEESSRRAIFKRMREDMEDQLEWEFQKWYRQKIAESKDKPMDYYVAGEDDFEDKGTFLPALLGNDIMSDYEFVVLRDSEKLHMYKNGYYQANSETYLEGEVSRRLGVNYQPERINKTKDYVKSRSYKSRSEFQTPDYKVNVKNGVYNVETEELIPHSPAYNFAFKIPWNYKPDATCPKIMKFLDEITNYDKEKREKILDMMAYSLLSSMPIAKALMMVGNGRNGKTIVIEVLKNLLGKKNKPYVNKTLQDLTASRFESSDLYGALAIVDDDLPPTEIEDTSEFKKITGGTDQRGERKYGGRFEFDPYATPIYAANRVPETKDDTTGFYRRWIIVNLPVEFVKNPEPDDPLQKERRRKKELLGELTSKSEMEGLLKNCIERLNRIACGDGFRYYRSVEEVRNCWKRHRDPIYDLLDNYIVQGVTKSEAERQSDGVKDLKYDYIRKDFLYELGKKHMKEQTGREIRNKEIKEKLEDSRISLNVGTKTRKEPDKAKYTNSNGVARVISGIKINLPERNSKESEEVPHYFYSTIDNYDESNQSLNIIDPKSNLYSNGNVIEDFIRENCNNDSCDRAEILTELLNKDSINWNKEEINQYIDSLNKEGVIYEPKPGEIRKL